MAVEEDWGLVMIANVSIWSFAGRNTPVRSFMHLLDFPLNGSTKMIPRLL